jgi:hypothetical protein
VRKTTRHCLRGLSTCKLSVLIMSRRLPFASGLYEPGVEKRLLEIFVASHERRIFAGHLCADRLSPSSHSRNTPRLGLTRRKPIAAQVPTQRPTRHLRRPRPTPCRRTALFPRCARSTPGCLEHTACRCGAVGTATAALPWCARGDACCHAPRLT